MTPLPGYMGKILRVDLTSGQIWDEALNADYARRFVGGSGLGARYLADYVTRDTDPLGSENPLIFMTGPFAATGIPAAGRHSVVARSPQTGLTGEANSGGFWGAELRASGYDGIIITGRANTPVYLSMVAGKTPQLHSARHLWGLDSYQTQDAVKGEMGESKARVACIGPAGENGVKFAAIMNDHGRAAARTGLGAVMGSKNLKAIGVRGNAHVPIADPAAFKPVLKETMHIVLDDVYTQIVRLGGTMMYMDVGMMYADVPVRYFSSAEDPLVEEHMNASVFSETMLDKAVPCHRCPISCGREVHLDNYNEPKVDGPEYETTVGFGPLIGAHDLQAAGYAGHLCNRYGLDTISCSSTIAFAYHLYNTGILTQAQTGGLALNWGDPAPAIQLIEQIAHRQGLGALLAEGSARAAAMLGVPDEAVHVNNLEVPMHDPRAFSGMALVYATSARGACHMAGDLYHVEQGRGAEDLGAELGNRFGETLEKAALSARTMDFRSFTNSAILCHFEDPGGETTARLMNTVTGSDYAWADLLHIGERITNFKRALNHRFGLTRANDTLPKKLTQALADGVSPGYAPNMAVLLPLYYQARGWDADTGRPTPETLRRLQLEEMLGELW